MNLVCGFIETYPAREAFLPIKYTRVMFSGLELLSLAPGESLLVTTDNHQRWFRVFKSYSTLIYTVCATDAKFLESFVYCGIQCIITCCVFV